MQWCFSQVKGTLDEDLTEGKNPRLYANRRLLGYERGFEYKSAAILYIEWLPLNSRSCTDWVSCCLSADIVSTVEFNHDGELLATGDKGGRIVIFQKEEAVSFESVTDKLNRLHDVLI